MAAYKSFDDAVKAVLSAREFQATKWPSANQENAGGRPFEEWLVLTDVYLAKLKTIYAETPAFKNDGNELNVEGLARVEKYAAVVANLMLWAVQAATAVEP